ncbi:MAG: dTDP-glucose 4,6-dehydratase [Candidatus Omnitrophica bacterium]|nr:dTDP-glucose 4,6-dehydratase [Candidatus Omnitrophota bacterium]
MRKNLPKILVTGGAGFIGSAFVRRAVKLGYRAVVADKLTYAGDMKRLRDASGFVFYKLDICDEKKLESLFRKEKPETVVHFAAETHVDRSIIDCAAFVRTNVIGTKILLDLSRKYKVKKFVHISTDEVYGDIERGKFREDFPLKPNSPYAASKASADLLIRSYVRTYGFPAIIVRPCNNYGPWQYPEKLIPLSILKVFRNEPIPVYGRGRNVREWLFVEDCADAVIRIMEKGRLGEIYNLGSSEEKQNLDVVKTILMACRKSEDGFEFVRDRPGHDFRYSLNSLKLRKEVGSPKKMRFEEGIRETLDWCLRNKDWLFSKWKDIQRLYGR